ncbi:MAG: hypothetical protein LBR38_02095 [Synergistaceae bacterium]|nr:hypothetical protein [Synergistaceae bacterium]
MKSRALTVAVAAVAVCCFAASAWGKFYAVEPLLVEQPPYAGMKFSLYKPYNAPAGWYATFDGYPVTKNKDGVWVYGTFNGPIITPTHYVVGSVVPSLAGLNPFPGSVQISSVTTLPDAGRSELATQPSVGARLGTAVPLPGTPSSTYMPDWLFDMRFMQLGGWKSSVDRVGVLNKPSLPVAWRGNYPRVIYAWTGHAWYHMTARSDGEHPTDIIRNHIYELTRMSKRSGFTWYESDTPVLSRQAMVWGYYWMGEVAPRQTGY